MAARRRHGSWAPVLLLGLGLAAEGRAGDRSSLEAAAKPLVAESSAFDYDLAVFEDRGADIFRQLAAGERAEILDRVAWARAEAAAERRALEGLERAAGAAKEPAGAPGPSGARVPARIADALEDFLARLDPELVRAIGAYPWPAYRRLLERRTQGPDEGLEAAAAGAVGELAERAVRLAGTCMARRRRRLRDALRALQYREGAADFLPHHRLDRAFYALQAGSAVKLDPGLGLPEPRPEDPIAALDPDPPMRLGPAATAPSGQVLPAVWERVLSASLAPVSDPVRAGAEAHRMRELATLQSRFEARIARGETGARDEAWEAYRHLRDRFDRVL